MKPQKKSKRITKRQYDTLFMDAHLLRRSLKDCLPMVSKLPCHIPGCDKCYQIDSAIKTAGEILNKTRKLAR